VAADGGPARPAGRRAKNGRLSRSADFERVYRQGRSHGNRYFVLHVFPRADAPGSVPGPGTQEAGPRLGLSVSRRVGGAVARNQVKRLLREALGSDGLRLAGGQDVVVVARPPALDLVRREGLDGVRTALGELVVKAGGELPGV